MNDWKLISLHNMSAYLYARFFKIKFCLCLCTKRMRYCSVSEPHAYILLIGTGSIPPPLGQALYLLHRVKKYWEIGKGMGHYWMKGLRSREGWSQLRRQQKSAEDGPRHFLSLPLVYKIKRNENSSNSKHILPPPPPHGGGGHPQGSLVLKWGQIQIPWLGSHTSCFSLDSVSVL